MKLSTDLKWAGLALGLLGAFYVYKKAKGLTVAGTASSVVVGAAHVVNDAIGGTVQGAASIFGVPETDTQKCKDAMNAGLKWDASLYCPLPVFVEFLTGNAASATAKLTGTPAVTAPPAPVIIPPMAAPNGYDTMIQNLNNAGAGVYG